MKNRWSAEARAASAAARLGKYGPMMGLRPWGDTARAAAAAARAERAALAGGMSPSEAVEVALDARYGEGYLSDGSYDIDVTLGIGRELSSGSYGGGRRIPTMSDATPFEERKAKYEAAFREWWKGVQATEQNIAAFHAFVAAMAGAAAGAMGSYRQATGEQPVAGMSRVFGRAGGYLSGKTPMYDESGVLAGWVKTGPARYGRTSRPVGRQPLSKAANLRFDLGRAKIVDPKTGRTVGRAAYSSDGDWPIPSRDMRGVQKAYDMGVRAFGDGTSLEQALRETGIIAGSEEAYMFQKGWGDAPAVTEAVERFEPYPVSISPETSDSLLADYGPQKVYDYGVSAYRDGLSLEEALHEAGVRPGTDAAFSVEKGYNDAVAILDTDEDDGAAVAEESLGEEYERYLDEVNAARDSEMAAKGLDPLGFPLSGGGYDPIADAEYDGRQAFLDGEDLREAVEEREIDLDTDSGMAFVLSFRAAKREASRSGRDLMEQARAGAVREPALSSAYAPRRSDRAAEDAYNELALMREPFYDKGRFGGRASQYKQALAVQSSFSAVGPRVGGAEAFNSARESLSAAFEAVAMGEDASSALAQAQVAVGELKDMPEYTFREEPVTGPSMLKPYVMDLPGGGNFDEASATLPDGFGDITPEQRSAARALGVLEGQWGVNGMVERMVPPQLVDEYEVGLAEGRKDPSEKPFAIPADRAAVVRAARAYLDGRIGDSDEEGSDVPDHLSDRWNVQDYASADTWASRNKKEVVPALADERGQYADAALVKAGLDWLGNAVADGDTPAADAAVTYLADLLGTVRAGKDKPASVLADDGDGDELDDAGDRVEFDEDGEEVEGERFFEDSYADPDLPLPWEYEGNTSFRKWFPGVRNRSAVANRIVAIDKYRARGLMNAWSDAARAASAAARLAKYGPMMGLRPWGDAARATAASARGAKWGGDGGGEGYTSSEDSSGVTLASSSRKPSGGGRKGRSSKRGADPVNAKAKFDAHGFDSLNDKQRISLFEDIKKRAEAGESLTESDRNFLALFEAFLDKEIKETTPATGDDYEVARAKFRLKHGRDPETDSEWAEAERLAGIPEEKRVYGAPIPKEPESERGHGDPEPADRSKAVVGEVRYGWAPAGVGGDGDAKALREEGLKRFREATGREPVTGSDYDRVDMLGGVPKEQWWDAALHDDQAPEDAGIGRARAKAVAAAGEAAREAKAAGRKAGVPGGNPPAHWGEAAKRRFRERQEEAVRQAGKEARAAKLREERAARSQARADMYTAGWADKAFTDLSPKRVKDSGEARAMRLAEERRQRREARKQQYTADWLKGGMPKSLGVVRDGLPASWDRRVPASSAAGFNVPRTSGVTYLGGGRFVDGDGRDVSGPSSAFRESDDGAVYYRGTWFDKKTGKAVKAGAKV